MKIEKLEAGQVFKNYKELCSFLEMDVKGGDSKKAQLVELGRFVNFEIVGRSFVIDEIFNSPLSIVPRGRKGKEYIDTIQDLIVSLIQEKDGMAFIAINALLYSIGATNVNYSRHIRNQKSLSEKLSIDIIEVNDFYSRVHDMFKKDIEKALNRLEDKGLILYTRDWAVIKHDENGYTIHQETDKEERLLLMKLQKETLDELQCSTFHELFKTGKMTAFNEKMEGKIKKTDILGYYVAYKITFLNEEIQKVYSDIDEKDKEEFKKMSSSLNCAVKQAIERNLEKRHLDSITTFGFGNHKTDILETRMGEQYTKNGRKMIGYLIDRQ